MTEPTTNAAPSGTVRADVRPDFGDVRVFCERERNAIAYAAEIVAVLGGDENPKLDCLEGWLFRVMTRALELRQTTGRSAAWDKPVLPPTYTHAT